MSDHRKFWEAGYSVFGLHPITKQRFCGCGKPDCKAIGKHPIMANWTSTPEWSEEQLETMEEAGQFDMGYGVLVKGLLVIDVDARNGGVESYELLIKDFSSVLATGMIVETGSGGGSKHLFFKIPEGLALSQNLDEYKGIDFKSSGFVVGSGSMHLSGNRYKTVIGSPDDIEDAPQELLDLLKKPERHRAIYESRTVDVSYNDLGEMLSYITNDDLDYDVWIKIGMSLHHASGGTAYDLWESWSATSSKHDPSDMSKKWHSFGKSANPVTLGTLVHYAEKGGWQWPVTFSTNEEVEEVVEDIIDVTGIDLRRPPGFVGEVAAWIHDQCRYVRENIAVGAALVTMGDVIGLKYADTENQVTSNLISFCVAGSGTGKESILKASTEILKTVGMNAAMYGNIKSEQEVVRNLVEHQPSVYVIDEVGFLLGKIQNAKSKGGASYLEGIIGVLMAVFSKANGHFLISGDVRKEVRKSLLQELNQLSRKLDDKPDPASQARYDSIEKHLDSLNTGIENPFMSLLGFTTNTNFESIVDFENAANGFIGRSLLFIEQDPVPAEKYPFEPRLMEECMKNTLQQLYAAGSFEMIKPVRIEHYGPKISIPTTDDARAMLRKAIVSLHNLAEDHAEKTGLEALFLRAKELVFKISFILAAPEGIRTVEHVRWAYALVKSDVEAKGRMVIGNDRKKDSPEDALFSSILNLVTGKEGQTFGVLVNKMRRYKKEEIEKGLERLVFKKLITVEETVHPRKKIHVKRYRKV
jgi:hypothetical protein